MFNVLIDTCVWLDLAADPRQRGLLETLDAFGQLGHIQLIVPRLVVQEFGKNRERVAKATAKGISSQVQQVKEAVRALELNARRKKTLLAGLDDVKHKLPQLAHAAEDALNRIDQMFGQATIVETSDATKIAAVDRALQRKAPCHHDNKNSIADAMLIEVYAHIVKAGRSGERFAFVTHNKHDFSGADHRKPHDDIAPLFTKIKSLYYLNLSELFARIDPAAYSEIRWEQSWQQESRTVTEIGEAMDLFLNQVWYNRHHNWLWRLEKGKEFIVSREEWEANKGKCGYTKKHTPEDIFLGARQSAQRVEKSLGAGNIGPWSDFEWGMINGKLSALRWVLGDEWDMLDT
ncbi:MAG: PIN domain-containing protein [Burkholderiaceae bacterium]|nr:PIN domain-containing protein [Burkholderiaceae bacterium]